MDEKKIIEIVKKVMSEMSGFVKCRDPKSGVMSISGNRVELEPFDIGIPGAKVWLKDVLTSEDNENIAAGYMALEDTDFPWTLTYDEIEYIIEGHLTIKIGDAVIKADAGDVVMIPANTSVVWSASAFTKLLYVTYPANWADLV